MQVHLEIPEDLAKQLAPEQGDLTRAAIEAVALEGVRSGKLTSLRPAGYLASRPATRWMAF
jgi:hypothetical protein